MDRSTYERRAARRAPGDTVRAALGHGALERPRVASIFAAADGGGRFLTLEDVGLADQRRAGRYLAAVRDLARDRYRTPAGVVLHGDAARRHFAARFSRWRPIGGQRIVSDPDGALALADAAREAGDEVLFDSPRRRPRRRRR
ncbi:MAG: hypothetical protein M0020_05765 [Actinomycetota bacterium]|nr:hypothetical protein [Actinomycetota bacterium]